MPPVLDIQDLRVSFDTYEGPVHALNGVNLDIGESEIVGLVGETGSGKSVLSTAMMNAVRFPGRITAGHVRLDGRDVLRMDEPALRRIRGAEISLIATNPRSKLNPMSRIGPQISDAIRAHQDLSRADALRRAITLLRAVGINDPLRRARAYPHELSGGMAQRVLIATALAVAPRLLITDEATSGLDVTVQRQVLDLIRDKVDEHRSSALIITHDLGIVAQYCHRVAIIYAGQIIEEAAVAELFAHPRHPYTISLLASARAAARQQTRLSLVGARPDLRRLPTGCLLQPRCPFDDHAACGSPQHMRETGPAHRVRCHRADQELHETADAAAA